MLYSNFLPSLNVYLAFKNCERDVLVILYSIKLEGKEENYYRPLFHTKVNHVCETLAPAEGCENNNSEKFHCATTAIFIPVLLRLLSAPLGWYV